MTALAYPLTLHKALTEWIVDIKMAGGIADGYETMDAMKAVTDLCWHVHKENGHSYNEMAQLGFKWIAAYTVSCSKNGTGDLLHILAASPRRKTAFAFAKEAQKNVAFLSDILAEAANAPEDLYNSAMPDAVVKLMIAPSGLGKGCGRVE